MERTIKASEHSGWRRRLMKNLARNLRELPDVCIHYRVSVWQAIDDNNREGRILCWLGKIGLQSAVLPGRSRTTRRMNSAGKSRSSRRTE
jgi:hypothetical protein